MIIDETNSVQGADSSSLSAPASWLMRGGASGGAGAAGRDMLAAHDEHTRKRKKTRSLAWWRHDDRKPHLLYIAIICVVVSSEFVLMLLMPDLPDLSREGKALMDASLLAMVTGPILFGLTFKPLMSNIAVRKETELKHEKVREMDLLRSEFMSIAAHELRTPLSVIRGYAELLLMKTMFDDSSRTEFASIINAKTNAMERLIDDLLDVNRLQAGRPLRIYKERQDLLATIAATLNDYRMAHPARPFVVHLPQEPVVFSFDPVRIAQVLENLLSNAVKFSARETPIEIEGSLQNGKFQLRISDRGIGMTDDEMSQVFDKFYRADTTDTSASGLGLGMAIVKEIIEAHGGEIWLESRVGEGTRVFFTLSSQS